MRDLFHKSCVILIILVLFSCSKKQGEESNPENTGTIKGKITDDVTGDSVPNAYIRVEDTSPWTFAVTDSNGNYIIPHISAGNYNLIASVSNWNPLPKKGFAFVPVMAGKETIRNIKIQCTKFELTAFDSSTLIMELYNVYPSILGMTELSLTKNPSDSLKNIIWDGIPIMEYNTTIRQVNKIIFTGAPLEFKYPEWQYMTLYFYPIQLTDINGQTENWYWQGEKLLGYRISSSSITTQLTVPLSSINRMVFIHENN